MLFDAIRRLFGIQQQQQHQQISEKDITEQRVAVWPEQKDFISDFLNSRLFVDEQNLEQALSTIKAKYPRIHEMIVSRWGTKSLHDWLSRIIISDRDNRKGFDQEVASSLLVVFNYHEAEFKFTNTKY